MMDEETGAEPRVVSASMADPYLLLVRDDSSAVVASMNKDSELEELDREDQTLITTKWLTGCLYVDKSGAFVSSDRKGVSGDAGVVMFLLSTTGTFSVSDPKLIIGSVLIRATCLDLCSS